MMPDDCKTIDNLRKSLDSCREVKATLRQCCDEAEVENGRMRATIEHLKRDIGDQKAGIDRLRAEIEGLKQQLDDRNEAYRCLW